MPQHRVWDENSKTPRNYFLASLPAESYQRLAPKLVAVELTHGMHLSEANEPIAALYFPETGLLSTNATTPAGESIEVGMTGREGFSGLPALLGQPEMQHEVVVQNPGNGFRLRTAAMLEEMALNPGIRPLVDNFIYVQMVTSTQSVLCARLHGLQQRLARWLLTASDRMESEHLQLTQEYMARMLGSRRSTVTVTAQALQEAGAIEYRRGKIHIVDRRKLESMACECYRIVQASYERLIPQANSSKL